MPAYPYLCKKCDNKWDVVKSVADYDTPESCPSCHAGDAKRYLVPVNFSGTKGWDAFYSPAVGKVVKNQRELNRIAKERGLIEVGTEKPETIHKHFDAQREKAAKDRWDNADREMVYE